MDAAEKRKIEALERQLTSERPWQLHGEVAAHSRPVNSLLFEDVNFEQRVKAPTITAETTEALEELIKQRIKDNKYDDPERKVKPSSSNLPGLKQIEVSSERSKVGLAQLYEQEILSKTGSNLVAKDGPEKEVRAKMYALFEKLDALIDR